MMTVGTLIEELKRFDPKLLVVRRSSSHDDDTERDYCTIDWPIALLVFGRDDFTFSAERYDNDDHPLDVVELY